MSGRSGTARTLSGAEQDAFRLARLAAAEQAPYFMHALFAASPVAVPGLGTFAVDGAWRLYLDPALLIGPDRWEPVTAGAVLQHEVGHLLRDHAARAAVLAPPLDHLAWNLAGDAEINDDLLAAGVPLPEGAVTPSALGCPPGELAEQYYAVLRPPSHGEPKGEPGLPDDGGGGCGSGAGCESVRGELPAQAGLPAGDGAPLSPAEADLVRRQVATDVQAASAAAGRGNMPVGLTRWADAVLAPPSVSWDRLLRAAIRRAVADRAGRVNYSYARPSRRPIPGIITPVMRAPSVRVAAVVDTSGSMSSGDLTAAMSEVQGVLRSCGLARDRLTVVSCDAAASTVQRIRSVSELRLSGGGGTDMRVGIRAVEQARPRADVVIVFTDGDTPWPDRPTRARLICAVISPWPASGAPSWATTVQIPPAA